MFVGVIPMSARRLSHCIRGYWNGLWRTCRGRRHYRRHILGWPDAVRKATHPVLREFTVGFQMPVLGCLPRVQRLVIFLRVPLIQLLQAVQILLLDSIQFLTAFLVPVLPRLRIGIILPADWEPL